MSTAPSESLITSEGLVCPHALSMLCANVHGELNTTYTLQCIGRQGRQPDLGCLMLGLVCLGQLLPEMGELLLSGRQVSSLPGKLVLQLG